MASTPSMGSPIINITTTQPTQKIHHIYQTKVNPNCDAIASRVRWPQFIMHREGENNQQQFNDIISIRIVFGIVCEDDGIYVYISYLR